MLHNRQQIWKEFERLIHHIKSQHKHNHLQQKHNDKNNTNNWVILLILTWFSFPLNCLCLVHQRILFSSSMKMQFPTHSTCSLLQFKASMKMQFSTVSSILSHFVPLFYLLCTFFRFELIHYLHLKLFICFIFPYFPWFSFNEIIYLSVSNHKSFYIFRSLLCSIVSHFSVVVFISFPRRMIFELFNILLYYIFPICEIPMRSKFRTCS